MKRLSYSEPGFQERLKQFDRTYQSNPEVVQSVRQIIAEVRQRGDRGLIEIHNRYTSVPLERADLTLKTKPKLPPVAVREALKKAMRNVEKFYQNRVPQSWSGRNSEGAEVGENYQPLERVGIYVPGGTAPLVSSAIMTVTLARVARVPEIVVCSPGPVAPALHYALRFAGATEIHQVGGAQAIAAMAYGTETIRPVVKVFGPGNAYVTEAKRQVFGRVGVDLLPGPSEIAVLADKTAKPAFLAADLLAQAEHGPGSQIFLITPEKKILEAVATEIEKQMSTLSRQQFLRETLNLGCSLILVKNLKQGVEIVEAIAPEHLSLCCSGAKTLARTIRNCGGIFVGDFSPVAAGDYAAGPSHELPTGGAGKTFSGLTIDQFVRRTSIVCYDRKALGRARRTVETLAATEGMDAHLESVAVRFRK
ncbi:MAG: histidinol dehydrogenase [Candidatus Methylacidiphilales bacterium]|nr:histidinol dehydrogenase [Candidatus Methylacidiphilales bacterium]